MTRKIAVNSNDISLLLSPCFVVDEDIVPFYRYSSFIVVFHNDIFCFLFFPPISEGICVYKTNNQPKGEERRRRHRKPRVLSPCGVNSQTDLY